MASFSGSSPRPTELPENPGLATFFQQERAETGPAPTPASVPAAAQGGSLDGFFRQDANPNRSGKPGGSNITPARNATLISTAAMDAIGQQEGLSPTQKRVMGALLGQESGNGQNAATSIDGARGAGQIMPDTFRHYAKPGEVIDNPAHNLAVMARIVKALGAQAGDDPAKMAVGYFSGSGNINPGSGAAWRNDRLDGNGKSVSSYTADVLARLGTTPNPTPNPTSNPTPAKAADPLASAPKWATVLAKPEYQAMSDSDKAGARQAYFAAFIEPGIAPEQKDTYRTWFEAEAAKAEDALKPSMLERIKTGASGLIDASRKLLQPDNPNASVMDGMLVSDPFAGDKYDASKVGMRQASLNRRATEAQLATMRQQIAHPPSFASAVDAPTSLSSMVGNAKDNLRAAEYGVGKGFATLGKYLTLLAAVPSIARDGMVGGDQASTIMFDNVVKPFDEAMRYYEHGNSALPQSVGTKVSHALGDLAATMPAIIATGGGVNPQTRYMVDIAKYAFAQGMNREAAMILVRGSADTLGNAMVTMSPAAIPGAFERYQMLIDSGVDSVTASKSAFAEFATTTAMGALPLWKSGGLATRITTGAAGGIGIAAASNTLQNQVLHQYPGQQQDPLERDNLIVGAVTGGVLAGLMGQPKAGKVIVTRTGQQNLPPRTEPEFKGTTLDGETGRPVGEPDLHAPRLGQRVEPPRDEVVPAGKAEADQRADSPPATRAASPEVVPPAKHQTIDQPERPRPSQPVQPVQPVQRTFTEQEIIGYADTRFRQLRTAQVGEIRETIDEDGQIFEVEKPGVALTPGETAELAALRQHRGNAQELAKLYGFNQAVPTPAAPAEPVSPIEPEIVNGCVVGDDAVMHHFYQAVLSDRSALKRRLERKSIAGFSHDMPRILANSITSNGRLAAQRYYTRDLMMAIKRIAREKGDVQKEAQRLKEFMDNPQDQGAIASSLAFSWFLGGNIASALVNATQPIMMTLPYLSQWGAASAAKALTAATLPAMGKQQITNAQLRIDLKRASQEGKVDSQEIFHLYSVGIQGVAAALTNHLGKLPVLGSKVKMASEDARARLMAFTTLWGMPFAMVEGFNRRLTFIAAWNMASEARRGDPYAFAIEAVDATQGIYNKVNRPNWARSSLGRTLFTFTQFRIMNAELLKRMATMGGAEGKKGAAMYLAIMILAAGVAGLPYAEDIDDIIDTMGQWLGYGTNMKRNKREWAHQTLGKGFGDFVLYGTSAHLPQDFGGRLGLGNMAPATGLGKVSGEGNRTREFLELAGPALGGLGHQVFDAYDAASIGDHGKAVKALMPTSIKNAAAGLDMAATGKAYDMKGQEKADVTLVDAMSKSIGFNPSVIANKNRANLPIMQDIALQKVVESNIVELWAQGAAKGDQAMMARAKVRMENWNKKNPDMPVMISTNQIMSKARQILTPVDARLLKNAPREMRGRVAAGLDGER